MRCQIPWSPSFRRARQQGPHMTGATPNRRHRPVRVMRRRPITAAPGALLLYAAFGSSRHLVVGPMAATAALSAAAVGDAAAGNSRAFPALTVTLALTVAALALAAGLLRLGFIANFISEPVLKGF